MLQCIGLAGLNKRLLQFKLNEKEPLLYHNEPIIRDGKMGHDKNWALEFKCKIGDLDIVGVDLITLGEDGLIDILEVTMRPLKSISELREAINSRVLKDPRFLKFKSALS